MVFFGFSLFLLVFKQKKEKCTFRFRPCLSVFNDKLQKQWYFVQIYALSVFLGETSNVRFAVSPRFYF